jgi:hypothetical protein
MPIAAAQAQCRQHLICHNAPTLREATRELLAGSAACGDSSASNPKGFAMSKVEPTRKRIKTGGRTKGVPNKATQEFRETVQKLLDDNRANVAKWLKLVAEGDDIKDVKPNPAKALELLSSLAEFAAPKLARTEHTGVDGGDIKTSLIVTFK